MIDFQEFTRIAVQGLNRKEARRVGKALDIAIAFGALEHAAGNESLQNLAQLRAGAESKMSELRGLS